MDILTPCAPLPIRVRVLLVCAHQLQTQKAKAWLAQWICPVDLLCASDPLEAMRLALGSSLHLALIDARVDGADGRALSRQLSRWNSELEVFAFDEPGSAGSLPTEGNWHWAELPMVLSWWQRRHEASHEPAVQPAWIA